MGGKSYYCDYCDCFMKNDINVRKNHNIGMIHNIAKANYMSKFKDPQEIINEESKKIPCNRFLNGKDCQFGAFCRYSHYKPDDLAYLQWMVEKNQLAKEKKLNSIAKNTPWKYPERIRHLCQLTPSLQEIDFEKITDACFQSEWG